ncbi:MAG: FAD-dependent thymidylate synthase, partial [Smithellaceae bacterium]|nr:FAD-dependent thymidylate synthase [Smithellaceae bacterium]
MIRKTNGVYDLVWQKHPEAAAYVLTNAHRKRVLIKLSARELYHLSRLRADAHAQWDIRDLAEKMLKQARKVMPLTLMTACGKDGFPALRHKIFPRK